MGKTTKAWDTARDDWAKMTGSPYFDHTAIRKTDVEWSLAYSLAATSSHVGLDGHSTRHGNAHFAWQVLCRCMHANSGALADMTAPDSIIDALNRQVRNEPPEQPEMLATVRQATSLVGLSADDRLWANLKALAHHFGLKLQKKRMWEGDRRDMFAGVTVHVPDDIQRLASMWTLYDTVTKETVSVRLSVDQILLGYDDDYMLCSDPHSQEKYPHYPNCTMSPENWVAPWPPPPPPVPVPRSSSVGCYWDKGEPDHFPATCDLPIVKAGGCPDGGLAAAGASTGVTLSACRSLCAADASHPRYFARCAERRDGVFLWRRRRQIWAQHRMQHVVCRRHSDGPCASMRRDRGQQHLPRRVTCVLLFATIRMQAVSGVYRNSQGNFVTTIYQENYRSSIESTS